MKLLRFAGKAIKAWIIYRVMYVFIGNILYEWRKLLRKSGISTKTDFYALPIKDMLKLASKAGADSGDIIGAKANKGFAMFKEENF